VTVHGTHSASFKTFITERLGRYAKEFEGQEIAPFLPAVMSFCRNFELPVSGEFLKKLRTPHARLVFSILTAPQLVLDQNRYWKGAFAADLIEVVLEPEKLTPEKASRIITSSFTNNFFGFLPPDGYKRESMPDITKLVDAVYYSSDEFGILNGKLIGEISLEEGLRRGSNLFRTPIACDPNEMGDGVFNRLALLLKLYILIGNNLIREGSHIPLYKLTQ